MKKKNIFIHKGTVISGFAGIGKTTAALRYDNVIDLESSHYFFNMPKDLEPHEYEQLKGDLHRIPNPNGLEDYVDAIIEAQKHFDYVLIAMFPALLQRLHEKGVDVQIVLPHKDDKRQYELRYRRRGNNIDWSKNMINNWELYIESTIKNNPFSKEPIIMESYSSLHEQTPNLSQIIDGRVRFKPGYISRQIESRLEQLDSNITVTRDHTFINVNVPIFVKAHNEIVTKKYAIDVAPLSNNKTIDVNADDIEIATYTVYPGFDDLDNYQFTYTPIKSDTDIDALIDMVVELVTLEHQLVTKMSDLQFRYNYDI